MVAWRQHGFLRAIEKISPHTYHYRVCLPHQYFPIFDQVDNLRAPSSVKDEEEYDPAQHSVVGSVTATLFWRDLIKNILPPGTNGVVVVFENPCNPTFTYQINGPTVAFLGRGDYHNSNFDYHRITSSFLNLQSFAVGDSSYSGPPLDENFCPFLLNIYPSDDMYADNTSNDPIIFTIAAVMIFVFTSAVFLLYDCTVERRQRLVLDSAERSGAIVSSLFPSEVKERLADVVAAESFKKKKTLGIPSSAKKRMQAFLAEEEGEDTRALISTAPPIASLYPETTGKAKSIMAR